MVNRDTINLIKQYEGLELQAYPDPATKNDPIKKGEPWTIGYGTTIYPNGVKVKKGDTINSSQAEQYLINDIISRENRLLAGIVKVKLNENQMGALVSFVYNLGEGNLKSSTLLKKVNSNPNDLSIAQEFSKWTKANGKILQGLVKRRAAESELYFKKVSNDI